MAKWEHYKAGGLIWRRSSGATPRPRRPQQGPFATKSRLTRPGRRSCDQHGRSRRVLASIARMLDELAGVRGMRRHADIRRFIIGMEQFGTRIQPLMRAARI